MTPPSAGGGPGAAAPVAASAGSRYATIRRVTLVGSVFDLGLGVAKIAGGWLAHSEALIADGLHSLSDLATDVLVLWAAKAAGAEADEEHPYGHGRIETVATVGLAVALFLVAGGIVWDAVAALADPAPEQPPLAWALWIALASVVIKEALYHYTIHHARRLDSNLLRANAWHTRTDAISSVVVIVGVGGAIAGWTYLDAVAAVLVAAMIAKIAYDLGRAGLEELIDTGLEAERLDHIRETILAIDGVRDLHELRTRRMAGRALVDVHILLADPFVSVSEGHQISEAVRARLRREIGDVEDVMVHIDPEDDAAQVLSAHLPSRREVMGRLLPRWAPVIPTERIRRVDLHYLAGGIRVEVELPVDLAPGLEAAVELEERLREAARPLPEVSHVRMLLSPWPPDGAIPE